METELQCGVCGSRGTHNVGAETAAPAVGCHCGVIVTGFTEAEATERWHELCRRAEIGRIVEALTVEQARPGDASPLSVRVYATDGSCLVSLRQRECAGPSLLDALRALAAEQATTVCKACGGSGDNRGGDCPKCDGTGIGGSDDD